MHKYIGNIQMIKVGVISLTQMRYALLCAKPNVAGMLQFCRVYPKVVGQGGGERAHARADSGKKSDILSEPKKS